MAQVDADGKPETIRERAKALLLKDFGVARVAQWCGVGEMAVYKWLSRGTDEQPIPADFVPMIIDGAKAAGMDAPLEVLWPAMARAAA